MPFMRLSLSRNREKPRKAAGGIRGQRKWGVRIQNAEPRCPLKMRRTGLGFGIDKDRPDYTLYSRRRRMACLSYVLLGPREVADGALQGEAKKLSPRDFRKAPAHSSRCFEAGSANRIFSSTQHHPSASVALISAALNQPPRFERLGSPPLFERVGPLPHFVLGAA